LTDLPHFVGVGRRDEERSHDRSLRRSLEVGRGRRPEGRPPGECGRQIGRLVIGSMARITAQPGEGSSGRRKRQAAPAKCRWSEALIGAAWSTFMNAPSRVLKRNFARRAAKERVAHGGVEPQSRRACASVRRNPASRETRLGLA
jgi:hypothetical protein